jgi:hypothetical protein
MKKLGRISKVAVFLLALVMPALAAGPIIIDNPWVPLVILAANGCGTFDVNAAPEAGKPNGGRIIQFFNQQGVFQSQISHGATFVTLTNLSNGKSINLNISGPAKFSAANNTSVNEGPTLFSGFPPAVAPPDLQGIALGHGRTVIQFDNSGNILSVSYTGSTPKNVCALLE